MPLFSYILVLFLWLWLGLTGAKAQDVRNIGDTEQNFPQYAPVISPDGSLFLYSVVGNSANFGQKNLADIWICQHLSDNQWSRPVNAGMPINTDLNDQCLSINLDKNEMFLLVEDEQGKKSLAQSKLSFRSWSTPQPMQIEPWDSSFQIQHGFVSNDGQTLLLCIRHADSTRRQSDIFVAQREGESSWKELQSLGPIINTPGQERSAFLAADGLTLYFASNGHGGFGGQDLYMSRRTSSSWTQWSKPSNLGSTFNSEYDDWGFYTSVIGERAWWTRSTKTPRIHSAAIPLSSRAQAVILVKGEVFLPQSQNPAPNVTVSLNYFDPQRGTRSLRQGISNAQGKYQLLLPRNAEMTINALSGKLFSPTYNLQRKGPAATEKEDSDEVMSALISANPTYRQIEEEIEALQLAYNQNLVALKNLNKERENYVAVILKEWEDTASLNIVKTMGANLTRLRFVYDSTQKVQASLRNRTTSSKRNDSDAALETFIPTDFDDFVRLIEIQQRWEILPATAQSLILQMLNEEVKRQDKEIDAEDRAIWRGQKEQILKNPNLLLLPEKEIAKWHGIFSPCFEWQENASREVSNLILQKNQAELTSQIKNEVRNYLRNLLDMRLLAAQSAAINQEIRTKVEGQLDIERGFQYRPQLKSLNTESTFTFDTLVVIAGTEIEQNIQLFDPIVEKTITLENVVFLPNQSELDSASYAEIHRLATFLKENPELRIEILAHTNNHCTYNFAADLTDRRAEKIANLLVQDQIPIERISHRGMGKEQPVATNSSPAGRLANQRVEIVFIQ